MKMNEQDLLLKLSQGSHAAFVSLFEYYYKDLVMFAGTWLRNEQEACEDIVQDVFLNLWEKRKEMAQVVSLKSFLLKSVQKRIEQPFAGGVGAVVSHAAAMF